MRHAAVAVVDQSRQRMRQLQDGEVVVTLADAQRNGFAGKPLLLLRALVGFALPRGAGQHTAHLAGQVDAGDLAKSQRLHEVVDRVHPHFIGQCVEVHIAGVLDGAVQVHRPQGMARAEGVAAKSPAAAVLDDGGRRALARLQPGQPHEGLVGGAGGVGAAQGAVEQRAVNGFIQRLPAFLVDAFHEQVGVVGRLAHHGQQLAGARVDGNRHATALAIQVFHHLLQLDVNRQHHALARGGRCAAQLAHGVTSGRCLHALHAGLAVQFLLVAGFHASLADVFGAAVVGSIFRIVDALLLALVDASDVADDVRTHLAHRVVAEQARLHIHAREAVALGGELGHLLVRQARADRQRIEVARILAQALEAAPVARRDVDDLGQRIDGLVDVCHLVGRDLQRVGRVVGGQQHAVAVVDLSPVGHDGHHGRAVALGLGQQVIVALHLQHIQARDEQRKAQQHHHADHHHPQLELAEVAFGIVDFGHRAGAALCGTKAAGFRHRRAAGAGAAAAASSPPATTAHTTGRA
ncbi:hypothetical protein D3C72_991280 [compost metagenome]